jgi:hypothetical protein
MAFPNSIGEERLAVRVRLHVTHGPHKFAEPKGHAADSGEKIQSMNHAASRALEGTMEERASS